MQRIIFVICGSLLLASTAFASPKLAKIIDLVGQGQVTVDGEKKAAAILLRLSAGDELRLNKGAMVRLQFFSNGHWETAKGPCVVRLTADRAQVVSGAPNCVSRGEAGAALLNAPSGNLEKMGGFQQRNLEPPKLTMKHAISGVPRFTWETRTPGPCEVSVFSRGGPTPLWKRTTDARQLDYDGPKLSEDTVYDWRVTFLASQSSRVTGFVILSRATLNEVERAHNAAQRLIARDQRDPAPYVLLEDFYADNYMLEEAIEAGRKAVALRPDDAGLHRALWQIYMEMPDPSAATNEEEKVQALEAKQKSR